MKKNQFNAIAAAVVLMTTVSFSSQAQVQPADSAAVPNQQGVVSPGRAVEMPLSATSVEKNPIGVGAYAPAKAIPAPGTPLPTQTTQAAPRREGMPSGIGGQIPIGSPALGWVQRPVAQGAPANAIPAPGTPLPTQTTQAAPRREGMPSGIGGKIPIGSPALGWVQRPVAQGAPAMPPLSGATAGKGSESTKTAQELRRASR